ncbi:MAG: response regulator transcription factor [Bryobacterales bacterium]|nr:response regulator transcription factor [Bryobacterales bacterium]
MKDSAPTVPAGHYVVVKGMDDLMALRSASSRDAVVIDTPDLDDALRLCHHARCRLPSTLLLIVTPHNDSSERTWALLHGADDCVSKPYDPCELDARILAGQRRACQSALTANIEFRFGRNVADFARWRVLRNGVPVNISYKELLLLRYLIAHSGCVIAREELLREVWDYQTTTTRTVDVHMAGLRQKLEDNPHAPEYLLTMRGAGYLFRAPSDVRKALHPERAFPATPWNGPRLFLQESSSETNEHK